MEVIGLRFYCVITVSGTGPFVIIVLLLSPFPFRGLLFTAAVMNAVRLSTSSVCVGPLLSVSLLSM